MNSINVKTDNFPSTCLIIGAGIGGLSIAALLAKYGCKVTVLDRCSDSVGGLAKTIEEKGFQFTFGPKYLWNFAEDEIGSKFLKAVGLNERVEMSYLDKDGFDRVYEESMDAALLVPRDLEEYKKRLRKAFPSDVSGLNKFFEKAEKKYEILRFAEQNELQFKGWRKSFLALAKKFWTRPLLLLGFFFEIRKTFEAVCDECKLSDSLRRVLFANGLIYAEPADTMSFYAYVGASFNYLRGAFFPALGFPHLINELKGVIEEHSGVIRMSTEVSRIETNGHGAIARVFDADGNSYDAELFVSNIDPSKFNSFFKADPGGYKPPSLPRYNYSNSLTSVFIGVHDASSIKPAFGNWNIWHCESGLLSSDLYSRSAMQPAPHVYLSAPTFMGDSGNDDSPPGGATLTAFVPASYNEYKAKLESSRLEHDELLDFQVQGIINLIENKYAPGLKGNISCVRAFSPINVEEQFSAPFGNVYGKSFSASDVTTKLPWDPPLSNLYAVGQFTTFAGVVNAILSSCKVFEVVSGIRIRHDF